MENGYRNKRLNSQARTAQKKRKGFVPNSSLVLFAFATAFFPRMLESLGAPAPINFLHFATVPLACGIVLATSRSKNRNQIKVTWAILSGLVIFLGAILASTLLNDAGLINAILDFILLGEPFVLLLAIISIPMSPDNFTKFKQWLVRFLLCHLFLVFVQKYILKVEYWDYLKMEPADRIQGVFFVSGAGHVVGAAVSLTFGLYYFIYSKRSPFWLRIAVGLATFWNLLIADAKQVLLAFMVAGVLLFFTKLKDATKAIEYLVGGIILGYIFLWCLQNVAAFQSFNTWIRPEIYGPNGEATLLKTAAFRIVPTHYDSFLNWLFGLGPGHTVGRLGGWMLREYASLLEPLGATRHIASKEVWQAVGASWLGDQSSMFSPLFGWAGIWGDLGIVGLGAYLYLAFLVWHYLCKDDFSKFLLLTVFVFGLIYSQMEEPGYMLSVVTVVGLRWQEIQIIRNRNRENIGRRINYS